MKIEIQPVGKTKVEPFKAGDIVIHKSGYIYILGEKDAEGRFPYMDMSARSAVLVWQKNAHFPHDCYSLFTGTITLSN